MISIVHWSRNKRTLIVALVMASSWFVLQVSRVPDPGSSSGPAISGVVLVVEHDNVLQQREQPIPISIKKEKRSSSIDTPSQSLKHASNLLRKAANVIEQDNTLAVQLIRQVIAILKHQVIPSLLDQNSTLLPISSLSGLAEQDSDREGPLRTMRE